MAMKPYSVNYDVNYFGTDNPANACGRADALRRQVNKKDLFVNIGIAPAPTAHVAGIAGNACSAAR
jgi:hypothetical protein